MKRVALNNLALIFDMDGVIVDSTATHTEAWGAYMAQHGIQLPGIESRMLGKRNDEIVRDFFANQPLSDAEVDRHGSRKEELYRTMIGPHLDDRMVPGIAGFIRRHSDLPIGLATNAEPANVDFILTGAGIKQHFKAIVNGYEVKRPKPFPDIYLRVSELLGVEPQNCIVFEDSTTGVQAARTAGMHVVGLTTTLTDIQDVDLRIASFLDPGIEPWLRTMASAG